MNAPAAIPSLPADVRHLALALPRQIAVRAAEAEGARVTVRQAVTLLRAKTQECERLERNAHILAEEFRGMVADRNRYRDRCATLTAQVARLTAELIGR